MEATLAISTKYQVVHIRAAVVKHLEAEWPQSLADWDKSLADVQVSRSFTTYLDLPEPCSAIRLARMYDIPTILPAAFYALSCINPHHAEWQPQTSGLEPPVWPWTWAHGRARWSLLSPIDFPLLLKGMESRRDRLSDPLTMQPSVLSDACTCGQTWLNENVDFTTLLKTRDPLIYLTRLDKKTEYSEFCSFCRRRVRVTIATRRKEIWSNLRVDFGLPECELFHTILIDGHHTESVSFRDCLYLVLGPISPKVHIYTLAFCQLLFHLLSLSHPFYSLNLFTSWRELSTQRNDSVSLGLPCA